MNRQQMVIGVMGFLLAHTGSVAAEVAIDPKQADESRLAADTTLELNLAVGENKTLPATDVDSYSVGAREIADVQLTPDKRQFVIVGEKQGSTTLLLLKKGKSQVTYTINVFPVPPRNVERELLTLLNDTPGIRVRRVGARFFIEGGVSKEGERDRIARIAELFRGQVENLVVVGGAAADRKLNVRIDFLFVQYNRSRSHDIGASWPASFGGPGVAELTGAFDFLSGAAVSARASVRNQALPGLDLAATNGWAKVLKHSTVITANGTEAKFSSGGEQNYVVSSGLSSALTQIRFGTDMTVLPRFDPATQELEIEVKADVMDLTQPVAAGTDLPGRSLSQLHTVVSLKLGQSLVLSGIQTREQRRVITGIPWLSEIPLLGVLFGSHGNIQRDVDGAIYIVPSVVESVPKGAQEILEDALKQYRQFDGDLATINAWDKAPAANGRSSGSALRARGQAH